MGNFIIRNRNTGRTELRTSSWGEIRSFFSARLDQLMNKKGLSHTEALRTVNSAYDVITED